MTDHASKALPIGARVAYVGDGKKYLKVAHGNPNACCEFAQEFGAPNELFWFWGDEITVIPPAIYEIAA